MQQPDPSDQMQAHSPAENAVFNEVYLHGGKTSKEINLVLNKSGKKVSLKEVEIALKAWQKRKWIERQRWKWYLTTAAIQYMR
jgi:predicted transcriptional regulator